MVEVEAAEKPADATGLLLTSNPVLIVITCDYCTTMALYNRWQNEVLFTCCDRLSTAQLEENRGMFFGSIFNTLNHILHVDQAILTMIYTGVLPSNFKPDVVPCSSYKALKLARDEFDQQLIQESQTIKQEWLDDVFEFWSDRLQKQRRLSRGFYYVQLFNHQTHHRSQVTSELHRLGIDYGNTDLPFNPYYP